MKSTVLANVYRGESDFRKTGEKGVKWYKTSVDAGGMQVFYRFLTAKYAKYAKKGQERTQGTKGNREAKSKIDGNRK